MACLNRAAAYAFVILLGCTRGARVAELDMIDGSISASAGPVGKLDGGLEKSQKSEAAHLARQAHAVPSGSSEIVSGLEKPEDDTEELARGLDFNFQMAIVIGFSFIIGLCCSCAYTKTTFDKNCADPADGSSAEAAEEHMPRIVNVTSLCDSRPQSYSDSEAHIRYVESVTLNRTVCLLLVGTILALFAFIFAALLQVEDRASVSLDVNGKPFKDGRMYYFPTISEFVADSNSPSGKVFFACVISGCMCVLFSWYPWYFSNVYVGDGVWGNGLFLNLRALLPPLGLLLVACIRVKASAQRTTGDHIVSMVHMAGAITALGGYCGLEMLTLFLYHEGRQGPRKGAVFKEGERRIRIVIAFLILLGLILFVGSMVTTRQDYGHHDVWAPVTIENIDKAMEDKKYEVVFEDARLMHSHQKGLLEVAGGMDLVAKQISFWGEWLAGFAMVLSHLVIWYFCPERHALRKEQSAAIGTEPMEKAAY